MVARSLAERLAPVLGVPVLVDNKPGGNSVIATRQVAMAPPDGHTLLLTTDIHAINAAYGGALPYDSLKDFAFVTQLTTSPLMLLAHPSAGMRTLGDVVAQARRSRAGCRSPRWARAVRTTSASSGSSAWRASTSSMCPTRAAGRRWWICSAARSTCR